MPPLLALSKAHHRPHSDQQRLPVKIAIGSTSLSAGQVGSAINTIADPIVGLNVAEFCQSNQR